jgi:hypothetical protein
MKRVLATILLAATLGAHAQGAPVPEVEALIRAIESSGCQMERNGDVHDARAAAEHLRMKLERSGRASMSPEQFIDYIASGSSLSGKPYHVLCPGKPPVESRTWLRARLAEMAPGR